MRQIKIKDYSDEEREMVTVKIDIEDGRTIEKACDITYYDDWVVYDYYLDLGREKFAYAEFQYFDREGVVV